MRGSDVGGLGNEELEVKVEVEVEVKAEKDKNDEGRKYKSRKKAR